MRLDDIVLLGFVDEALKYLKKEAKDDERPEIDKLISQLDIEKMKGNLNDKFGNSFIGANEVIKALMKSGNDAFFDFTSKEYRTDKITNEINDLFDDSFLNDDEPNIGNIKLNIDENSIKQAQLKKNLVGFVNEIKTKLNSEDENADLPFISDDDDIYNAIRNATYRDGHIDEVNNEDRDIPFDENELNQVIKDINKGVTDNNEYSDEYHNQYVNSLMSDLQKRMNMGMYENTQEGVDYKNRQYVSDLMNDLQNQMNISEEQRKENEEKEKIYKEIGEVYEHLPRKFIHVVYDARQVIVKDLEKDERVILLHRVRFNELVYVRQFAEILLSHDFNVNVDEDQKIVDGIKLTNNSDGKIITSIFEVANQAYLLEGVYDGYRVIKEDDANI